MAAWDVVHWTILQIEVQDAGMQAAKLAVD